MSDDFEVSARLVCVCFSSKNRVNGFLVASLRPVCRCSGKVVASRHLAPDLHLVRVTATYSPHSFEINVVCTVNVMMIL